MDFITYPVNVKNPGSVIPVLFGVQWGGLSSWQKNSFIVYLDIMSRKREHPFDLKEWLIANGFDPQKILKERSRQLPLLFKSFRAEINLKVCEGFWYKCRCGKVEFLDQTILDKSYKKYLKLIDKQNKCILCNSEVVLCKNRGLIAKIYPDKSFSIEDYSERDKIYPTNVHREIKHWIHFFSGKDILLSRVRETSYQIEYENEKFYLDPTLFNIFSTFLEREDVYVITGREATISYALGLLFFGKGPNHIFLPRFNISNWSELTSINFSELSLFFIGNTNWKKNKMSLNFSDLKFIKKHETELNKKLENTRVSSINDLAVFSRNFYSL